ncbi:MAG TPA: pitrilysin family protein [Vicinamibacterales bacterium]
MIASLSWRAAPALLRALALGTALVASTAGVCAQGRNWPVDKPPSPLEEHEVKFPSYALQSLANGLQVVAVSHHEQPAVTLRLIVRAGAAQDPDGKPGVADLAAALLDQGTATRSAEQIADGIDSIGGALSTGAGLDLSYINVVVLKDSFDVALNLVADLAQHPAFAPEEIERQRQQALSGMRVSYDDPEFLANAVFDRLVFGAHPYGRPQGGTPETLVAVTRADLIAFHRRWFGANNAILAIVGDVTPDEAFAGAGRAFGSWVRAAADAPRPADPPTPARRLVIVDKPGAVQTEIRVGNLAIPRRNDDYMALDLAAKVLGGEGANRLHRVLRSERGLTYGASADFNALKQSGDIVARTNTRSETTGETLRLMVDEVWKLILHRVGTRELQGAQQYLTGSFPLTIETPSQIALQILNGLFYGLNMNELQTYRERVSAVSVEDVLRVARNYLHPDQLTIVLVGDASAFVRQLPGAGFDRYEIIPAAQLDLAAPDLRRPRSASRGYQPAVYFQESKAGKQEARPPNSAKALLDKAIAAKGGLAKLQSIKTVRSEGTMIVTDLNGPVPFKVVANIEYPERFRVDADMPGGKIAQVYSAGRYWIIEPDGKASEMPEEGRPAIKASVQRDTIAVLVKAAAGKLVVREVDSDEPVLAAIEVSGPDLAPVTFFVNRVNGLIDRSRYGGPDGTIEERYADYRDVDGIQIPFHTVVRRAGLTSIERDVRTIKFNVPLAPGIFEKPG